jgi:diguanylate cyclase (GGDEF)-like protein
MIQKTQCNGLETAGSLALAHKVCGNAERRIAATFPVTETIAMVTRRRVVLHARERLLLRTSGVAQRVLLRMADSLRVAQAEVARLTVQALHDALTGLPNRHRLEQFWTDAAACRRSADTFLDVLLVDVDDFKSINDRHSHSVGDSVLRSVGCILQTHLRRDDLAVRLGGDEFAVVLRDSEPTRGSRLARRIQCAIAAHDWSSTSPGLHVSVSVGVSRGPVRQPLSVLLHEADLAMYDDKRERRSSTGVVQLPTKCAD